MRVVATVHPWTTNVSLSRIDADELTGRLRQVLRFRRIVLFVADGQIEHIVRAKVEPTAPVVGNDLVGGDDMVFPDQNLVAGVCMIHVVDEPGDARLVGLRIVIIQVEIVVILEIRIKRD